MWFSADRGETWRPLDDWQVSDLSDMGNIANALSCGAVHVIWGARADGSDDIVWVGTGEMALTSDGQQALAGAAPGGPQLGGSVVGIGFLNRDPAVAGRSWTVVKGDPPGTDPDTLRGESFYRIVGDPGNRDQLMAGTTKGLYLKPPGADWTRVTAFAASVSVQPMDVLMADRSRRSSEGTPGLWATRRPPRRWRPDRRCSTPVPTQWRMAATRSWFSGPTGSGIRETGDARGSRCRRRPTLAAATTRT